MSYLLQRNVLALILPMLLLAACTKEQASLPYAEITAFSLPDASGKPLQAAIAGQEIIIYWPFEQKMPDTIAPQVRVSEKATIQPASGARVPMQGGTTYTVKSESGVTATYQLRIVSTQPSPVITTPDGGYAFIGENGLTNIAVLYAIPDLKRTRISLISRTGTKISAAIDSITRERIYYRYPQVLDSGVYKLMLETGAYTITRKTDLYLRKDAPALEDYGQLTLQRGQTFTLKASGLGVITEAMLIRNIEGDSQVLEIIGNTGMLVTLRVPANAAPGTYEYGVALMDNYYAYKDYIGLESPVVIQ